jgi:hypothetical protein
MEESAMSGWPVATRVLELKGDKSYRDLEEAAALPSPACALIWTQQLVLYSTLLPLSLHQAVQQAALRKEPPAFVLWEEL